MNTGLLLVRNGTVVGHYSGYLGLIEAMGITVEEYDIGLKIKQEGRKVYPVYSKEWTPLEAAIDWVKKHHKHKESGYEIYEYCKDARYDHQNRG